MLSVRTDGDDKVPRSLVNAILALVIGEPLESVRLTSTRFVFSAGRRTVSLQPELFTASTQDNVVILIMLFSPESGLGIKEKSKVLVTVLLLAV